MTRRFSAVLLPPSSFRRPWPASGRPWHAA